MKDLSLLTRKRRHSPTTGCAGFASKSFGHAARDLLGRSQVRHSPMVNTRNAILGAIALGALLICIAMPTTAEEPVCNQDAMLVFDASGSMSGDGWGYGSGSANTVPRILKVRAALAKVLPDITRYRRVGLITFGPNQCNVLSAKLAKRFRDSDQLPLIAGLSPKHYAGVVRIFESTSESLGAPCQLRIST